MIECQNLECMIYEIDLSLNEYVGDYLFWFLWLLFFFQVYFGNILNIYYWWLVDVDYVVVWCGWYMVDGVDSEVVCCFVVQDCFMIVEEDIYLVELVQWGLKSCGYMFGLLVLDFVCGVNLEYFVKVL